MLLPISSRGESLMCLAVLSLSLAIKHGVCYFVENSFSGRVVALAIYEAHCSVTWQVKYVKTHMLYSLRLNISIQEMGDEF